MGTTAPMHKNWNQTLRRVDTFISTTGIFKDASLATQIHTNFTPITKLSHWELPGGSGSWKDWTFEQIIAQEFTEVGVGTSYGPTWHTHWFKLEITVPSSYIGKEVHLLWNSGTEAGVYNSTGQLLGAFGAGFRDDFVISKEWSDERELVYYLEMTCNGIVGAGGGNDIAPTDDNKYYVLSRCEIGIFNPLIYKIVTDIDMLRGIAVELPNDPRGFKALFCANEMINLIRKEENYEKASQIGTDFFGEKGGAKNHTLMSMGHCHIDTAWLWPYDETKRKCARSWVSQLRLMEVYPDFKFVCSQAQQFSWIKEYYPQLYEQIKASIGRFVPVGGTWVEMDGNIPSGEAFIRQFYYGQKFFKQEFGITCNEFWLPDTFGYSAQIPQLMKHVGIGRFLTIKMGWNIVNKFPTQNFWWEGIDGSQVLSHFPPSNNPNMTGAVSEIMYTQNNSEDKGRSSNSIYLFGVGDGGGGPTRQMIERQNRLKDVDGLPRVEYGEPNTFFERLEAEGGKLSKWVGELYFERHNGTYTTQAKIKWYNRKGEFFFRQVEHLMAQAYILSKVTQTELDTDQLILDKNWQSFLLNQFHDVLPGTCVAIVKTDAWDIYVQVFTALTALQSKYTALLLSNGTTNSVIFNPLHWPIQTVIFNRSNSGQIPTLPGIQSVELDPLDFGESDQGQFKVPNSFGAALVQLNPSGFTRVDPIVPTVNAVTLTFNETRAEMGNGLIRVQVDISGSVPVEEIFYQGANGTEYKVFGDRLNTRILGGMFYIYDDVPDEWDAWDVPDYHLETQRMPNWSEMNGFTSCANGPIVGAYKLTAKFGLSSLTRYTILRANSPMLEYYTIVDWKEKHKLLKVEFPLDILARDATSEIQFGHLKRPTHINTSWDMAKYEVVGHKWMDMSQADRGVTIITDSKYGWHSRDNLISLSLLRSPKNPDKECDMHKHFIYYAVLPHTGSFQKANVIRRAYELNYLSANNVPFWTTNLTDDQLPRDLVTIVNNEAVVLSAIKTAPGQSKMTLVRLYESHGGQVKDVQIKLGFPVKAVKECDGLESPLTGENLIVTDNSFRTDFGPFKIKSFLVEF